MKRLSKLISFILAFVLTATMTAVPAFANTAGSGTENDPYLISTSQELQNINNNVSAHYKLVANIDLMNADFTPIGNADSGAFSGSFDGNGFTISNLNVFAGKYAGLFGCNEGTIKNVTLSDIFVYGTKYVGGVCGENTKLGILENCHVLSGNIESDGGLTELNVGGICGCNNGEFTGKFLNNANINLNIDSKTNIVTNVGGILGTNNSFINLSGQNNGNIRLNIYSKRSHAVGGILGKTNSFVKILDCLNNGKIEPSIYAISRCGGIVGWADNSIQIERCVNTGNILNGAGILGNITVGDCYITDCYNTGDFGYSYWDNAYFGGWYPYPYYFAGGILGSTTDSSSYIKNCYNSGNCIPLKGDSDVHRGGLGYIRGINSGSNSETTNCYTLNQLNKNECSDYYIRYINNGEFLSIENMKNQSSYIGWDFDNTWQINENINNGLPTLRTISSQLELNYSFYKATLDSEIQLNAFSNGIATSDITWSTDANNVTINNNGIVVIHSPGSAVVTAIDKFGNKANCTIYVYEAIKFESVKELTFNIANINKYIDCRNSTGVDVSKDNIISWHSNNENIVKVNDIGYFSPINIGTTTVDAITLSGNVITQTVKVVDNAIDLNLHSLTVPRNTKKQIDYTISPNPTSSKITWSSSDTSVATVDENGIVTGVNIGSAIITAKTDNGISATCTVTVKAPITAMEFEIPSITMYKGEQQKLNVIYEPFDTTDRITYDYSSSCATIDSDSGVVTAKSVGNSTITATSSSGVRATCTVKVIDYPVIVTGIELDKAESNMKVGEAFKLNAAVSPSNADDKTVTWASTDESVATVSDQGIVKSIGAGKTVITATTVNGIIAYCIVNVEGVASTNLSKIYIPQILATDTEYVDVPVMIENNPGINFANLSVLYNADELEPVEVKNGKVFGSVLGSIDKENNKIRLTFVSEDDVDTNGILAIIRYKVLNKEATPELKLCYFPSEIRNQANEAVPFNLGDGIVTIPDELPNVKIKGASLVLYDDISVRFLVDKATADANELDGMNMVFEFDGETIETSEYTANDKYYMFTFNHIAPNELNSIITAKFYSNINGEEVLLDTYEYSVAKYCYNMLNKYPAETHPEYAELRTLLVDLLNYGAASQIYTSFNTDNLANANLTEEQRAYGTTEDLDLKTVANSSYKVVENPKAQWFAKGLSLYNSVIMKFYFRAEDITNLSVKVEAYGQEWIIPSSEFKQYATGQYYVEFNKLCAGDMSENVYITVYEDDTAVSNTYLYSIESYAYAKQNDADENLANLVMAMMKYGKSAYEYAN